MKITEPTMSNIYPGRSQNIHQEAVGIPVMPTRTFIRSPNDLRSMHRDTRNLVVKRRVTGDTVRWLCRDLPGRTSQTLVKALAGSVVPGP